MFNVEVVLDGKLNGIDQSQLKLTVFGRAGRGSRLSMRRMAYHAI